MSAAPTPYERVFDFTSFSVNNPSSQQPGNQIDAELNAVQQSMNQTQARLSQIQRDDGPIANGVVTYSSLSDDVLSILTTSGAAVRGAWVTNTPYFVKDVVSATDGTYICATDHVSGVFADDLAGGDWIIISLSQSYPSAKSFANAAERATTAPDAINQIGVQQDDNTLWVGKSTTSGDWTINKAIIPDNSILLTKLPDGVLTADAAGRAKVADSFVTLSKISDSIFTSDVAGRAKFATSFVDYSLVSSGMMISRNSITNDLNTTINSTIPIDDTIPQISEGVQILTINVTPKTATSIFRVRFSGIAGISGGNAAVAAMFKDAGANAIKASAFWVYGNDLFPFFLEHEFAVSVIDSFSISIRVGCISTMAINGIPSARRFGGAANCQLIIEEFKA